jgi:hypothetical protein
MSETMVTSFVAMIAAPLQDMTLKENVGWMPSVDMFICYLHEVHEIVNLWGGLKFGTDFDKIWYLDLQ